jgi:multiple sugar transport system permease protein
MNFKKLIKSLLIFIIILTILIFFMLPIIWTILLAFKPPELTFATPPVFIFKPTLRHFIYILINPGLNLKHLINSIIESFGATLIALILSTPAAFSFSRFNFRGKNQILFWYIGIYLAPPIIFTIPYYFIINWLGWVGTYQSFWLVYQTFSIPLAVWLLKGFFDNIPKDLEEAAMIDGCSRLKALFYILIPATAQGLIITALFVYVFCWNNMLFPLVLANPVTKPLTVGTMEYFTMVGVTWNYIGAAAVITMFPPVIILLAFHKYLVKGLTFGAIKG